MPGVPAELWLHHSVTQLTADPFADMKVIERIGVQRFGRFSYSWAYHARARVLLEGAGNTVGAHTAGRNSTSLGLVLIGNFEELDLTDDNVADLRWSIAWLIAGNRLKAGTYPTGGHRDLKQTACPGGRAYARIDDIRRQVSPPEDDVKNYTVLVIKDKGFHVLTPVGTRIWIPTIEDVGAWLNAGAGKVEITERQLNVIPEAA